MSTKQLNTRIQLKHDFEENWITAGNSDKPFVPKSGEVIIYDAEVDSNGNALTIDNKPQKTVGTARRPRIKIGDGKTNVNELEFVSNDNIKSSEIFEKLTLPEIGTNIYFKPIDPDWVPVFEVTDIKYSGDNGAELAIHDEASTVKIAIPKQKYYVTGSQKYKLIYNAEGKRIYEENFPPLQQYVFNVCPHYKISHDKSISKTLVDADSNEVTATCYALEATNKDGYGFRRYVTIFEYVDTSITAGFKESITLRAQQQMFENLLFTTNTDGTAKVENLYKYIDKNNNTRYTIYQNYTPDIKPSISDKPSEEIKPVTVDNDDEKMLRRIQLEALFNGGEKYSHGENNYVTIQGKDVVAYGEGSVSIGKENLALQANALALGEESLVRSENGFSAGHKSIVTGKRGAAINDGAYALGYASFASGGDTRALGDYSVAEGTDTRAIGYNSHAEGRKTQAIGYYSHAENYYTIASGTGSHSEGGNGTKALGDYSHAEGIGSVAEGSQSHAEGNCTHAINNSHAEGRSSIASGYISHAEGFCSIAKGEQSHAEGYGTYAGGKGAHAEGSSSIKTIQLTGAAGTTEYSCKDAPELEVGYEIHYKNIVAKITKVAGNNINRVQLDKTLSETTALENASVQVVYNRVKALGSASHAEGTATIAASANQHVQGRYNIEDDEDNFAHIVGNGNATARSNAHTLDWNGNAWYAGDVYVSEGGKDTPKKLATEDYVNSKAGSTVLIGTATELTGTFTPGTLLIDTSKEDGGLKYYKIDDETEIGAWVTVPVRFS